MSVRRPISASFLGFLLAAALLAGCGGGGGGAVPGPPDPPNPPVEGFDDSFLELGTPGTQDVLEDVVFVAGVYELSATEQYVLVSDDLLEVALPARSYGAGDFLIGQHAEGMGTFLRRVTAAGPRSGGGLALEIQTAALSDIIAEGSLTIDATPDWGEGGGLTALSLVGPGAQGGRNALSVGNDGTVRITDHVLYDNAKAFSGKIGFADLSGGGALQITLKEGWLRLVPTMRAKLDFSGASVRSAEVGFDALFEFGVDLEVNTELTGALELGGDLLKVEYPIVIPTTPPIQVSLELTIPWDASMQASVTGTARFRYESRCALAVDLAWNKTDGFSVARKYSRDLVDQSVDWNAVGRIQAQLGVGARVACKLYDFIGPYLYVRPSVEADLVFPWELDRPELFVRLEGGAGLDITVPIIDKVLLSKGVDFVLNEGVSFDLIGPRSGDMPANGAPVALADSYELGRNGGVLDLEADDPDSDPLVYRVNRAPLHGRLISSGQPPAQPRYVPDTGWSGQDSFEWSAGDGKAWSEPATAQVTVRNSLAPTAAFSTDRAGTTALVDASASTDPEDATASLMFRWDWTADGNWDTAWSSSATASHEYGDSRLHVVVLEVRDTDGLTDTARSTAVGGRYPTEFQPYGTAPVLEIGGDNASVYESYHVLSPHVLVEGGIYKMWYTGYRHAGGLTPRTAICYATSSDKGKTWTKHGSVLEVTETWEEGSGAGYPSVSHASVIKDGGIYRMWYVATEGVLGYCESSDGVNWPVGDKMLMSDTVNHIYPTVCKLDSGYMLFTRAPSESSILAMESSDGGVNDPWTYVNGGNPVFSPSASGWDTAVYGVFVWHNPYHDRIEMWYGGGTAGDDHHKLGLATSTDGVSWTRHTTYPLLSGASGAWNDRATYDPSIIYDPSDKTFRLFFVGYPVGMDRGQIGLAEASADGI